MAKTLNVFETFSGIGAQHKALYNIFKDKKNIEKHGLANKDYKVIGTSEWYINGIIAYDAIHHGPIENFKGHEKLTKEEMLDFIKGFDLSRDSKNLYPFERIAKFPEEKIKKLYIGLKRNKNYGSITGIKGKDLPRVDLLTYSFPCFLKGTLVMTDTGYKKIEEIKKGDKVLTHTNTFQNVVKPMTNMADHIYQLSTMASEDIFVTEEHPFYVRRKERTWDNIEKKRGRLFHEPEWRTIKDLNKDYYMGIAINQKKKFPEWKGVEDNRWGHGKCTNKLSELFEKKDFWWIVGLYIGDGWTQINTNKHNYKTVICASKNNNQHLKIEKKLRTLGIKYNKVEENTTFKFHIPWKEFTIYLEQFGKYAHGKHLTNDIFDLPKTHLKKFIQGYIYADGNINKAETLRFQITSVSQELIYGIGQCVAKAYERPYSIYKDKRPNTCTIEGRTVNQRDTYTIRFKLKSKKQDKAFYENGYIWFPINKIIKKEYIGLVYNMEVENDNSYTVNNIICHNCQDVSAIGHSKGIAKNLQECDSTATRSGLLWEIERILFELKELNKLPKFLVMENVKALIQKNHLEDWKVFARTLEDMGYLNTTLLLNAKDFGVPQGRERVFVISELGGTTNINVDKTGLWPKKLGDYFEFDNPEYHEERMACIPNDTPVRRKTWIDNKKIHFDTDHFHTLTTKVDRNPNCGCIVFPNEEYHTDKDGNKFLKSQFRYITPREAFRMMGFESEDFERVKSVGIQNKEEIYRLAGNSIVVNVLEAIFTSILKKF